MTDKTDKTIAVLVVEDYPSDLALMRQMLASASPVRFEIIHASNLSSAIAQVGSGPDIVLLDLNLPDSQDLNTLRSMRAAAPTTPIIILTGMSDRGNAVKALANGAQDYLVKGRVDGHLLVRAILRHLPAMTAGTKDTLVT
jgi:DNA-binding response OmpR family regulator